MNTSRLVVVGASLAGLRAVEPGRTLRTGETAILPAESVDMVARIGPVTSVSAVGAVGAVDGAFVYRTDKIDERKTNGVTTLAAHTDLLDAVSGEIASGRWLDEALAAYPTVVLGATSAERLGVSRTDGTVAVWLGKRWFTVVGVLAPVPLAPELDRRGSACRSARRAGVARRRRRADQAVRALPGVGGRRDPRRAAGHGQPGQS